MALIQYGLSLLAIVSTQGMANELLPGFAVDGQAQSSRGVSAASTWRALGKNTYRYRLNQVCSCAEGGELWVYVVGSRVVALQRVYDGRVFNDKNTLRNYHTIDELNDLISAELAKSPDWVEIYRNRYFGFPEKVALNPSYFVQDDEIEFSIRSVEFLKIVH